jgi:hypothetical protein
MGTICDCERSHNGVGIADRECDCMEENEKDELMTDEVESQNLQITFTEDDQDNVILNAMRNWQRVIAISDASHYIVPFNSLIDELQRMEYEEGTCVTVSSYDPKLLELNPNVYPYAMEIIEPVDDSSVHYTLTLEMNWGYEHVSNECT